MAGSTNVLREFLVKIGFKVDEQKFKNFQEAMRTTGKNAAEMGKSALAASTVLGTSLKLIAQQMEGLYFASQRTGASTRELKEFSFAAAQIGVSAEQAQGAIEGLAAARRTNPGLNGLLGTMGIDPKQTDNARVLLQLLTKLHNMPYFQAAQIAGVFGINEQSFNMLEAGLPQMQKYLALREKMFRQAGINPDEMAKRGHEFNTELRGFEAGASALADIIAFRLMPAGEKVIGWLGSVIAWMTKADKATSGFSSTVLGLGSALAGGNLLKGGASFVARLLGGSAASAGSAAAGEAAGGAAVAGAAGGAGLIPSILGALATTGLIAVLVAAAAAIVNPQAIQKMLHLPDRITGETVKGWVVSAWKATGIGQIAQSVNEQAKAAGGWTKALSLVDGPIGNLARMVASFEGHVKDGYGVYKDIAGHLTAGFGHLVRPGEDFSHLDRAGALALLAKDLSQAVSSVARLVRVHLNKNQADALADFRFNIGETKFAHSTLLKKLNSGDFAGAADQFQYWNHALINGHRTTLKALSERRAAEAALFRAPDKTTTISQHADIKVEGVRDPHEAGRAVGEAASRAFSDMLRNMKEAVY